MNDKAPSSRMDTHVPSELFELVLPSVESLLPCRVTRFLISTAMPVSVLRRMVLRSFLVPPSAEHRLRIFFPPFIQDNTTKKKRSIEEKARHDRRSSRGFSGWCFHVSPLTLGVYACLFPYASPAMSWQRFRDVPPPLTQWLLG